MTNLCRAFLVAARDRTQPATSYQLPATSYLLAAVGFRFEVFAGRRAFAFAAGFFAAARRGFGLAGSCIVASIFTSCLVSSRQTPGVSFGSEIGPMATRLSFDTGFPMAWNILRI